ncbi:unnamed protein product [Ambrosiozyma monospora]|uniref:Unnamed protein product n=1 Tax=Ambrosiozyma monospora TaxID=43982 RepID=A0A9W7DFU7_AMBMO|nr:unnamed protein product [Ambrosiozyma monospora]
MSKSEFPAGSLVLTKIKGFPEWPSRVIPFDLLPERIQNIKPKSIKKRAPKSKKTPRDNDPVEILCVKFYGDDEYIWCSNQDLKPLTYEGIDEFLIKKGEIPDKDGNIVGKKAAKTNKVTNAFLLARNKELSWEDFAEYGSYGEPEEEEEEEEEEVEEDVEEESVEEDEKEVEVEAPKSKKRKAATKKAPPKKKAKTETKTKTTKATPKLKLKVAKAEPKAKKSDTKAKATVKAKGKGKAAPKTKKGKGKVKQEVEDEEEEEDDDYELNDKEEEEEAREEEEAEEEMVKEEEEELKEEQEADWGLESDTENDEHIIDKETFPTSEILAEEVKACTQAYSDMRVQIQAVLIPSTEAETNGDTGQKANPSN